MAKDFCLYSVDCHVPGYRGWSWVCTAYGSGWCPSLSSEGGSSSRTEWKRVYTSVVMCDRLAGLSVRGSLVESHRCVLGYIPLISVRCSEECGLWSKSSGLEAWFHHLPVVHLSTYYLISLSLNVLIHKKRDSKMPDGLNQVSKPVPVLDTY